MILCAWVILQRRAFCTFVLLFDPVVHRIEKLIVIYVICKHTCSMVKKLQYEHPSLVALNEALLDA